MIGYSMNLIDTPIVMIYLFNLRSWRIYRELLFVYGLM